MPVKSLARLAITWASHQDAVELGDRSGSASRLKEAFLEQERPNESGSFRPRKARDVQESRGASTRFPPGCELQNSIS